LSRESSLGCITSSVTCAPTCFVGFIVRLRQLVAKYGNRNDHIGFVAAWLPQKLSADGQAMAYNDNYRSETQPTTTLGWMALGI
jgi:hypothetical protein